MTHTVSILQIVFQIPLNRSESFKNIQHTCMDMNKCIFTIPGKTNYDHLATLILICTNVGDRFEHFFDLSPTF